MAKINTVANNGLTIVENYNKLFEQIAKAKTVDDVRSLVASVKDFISVYKRVDKNMVNEVYGKLQSKLQDMVAENAFVYERMNSKVEEIRNRGYDYANEKDDSQAVQSKALQLMSQMPKVMNSNHANRITKILNDSINSGVIGSKAVLELLKYPAYADMVSAKVIIPYFKGYKLAYIKTPNVEAFLKTLVNDYSSGTITGYANVLSGVFKTAKRWNMIDNNPCQDARKPKKKQEETGLKYFTPEQSLMFLKSLNMSYEVTYKGHQRIDDTGKPYYVNEYTESYTVPTQYKVFYG